MKSFGYSLLELLITLSILLILLAIGIPSFSSQIQRTKVKTFTLDLQTSAARARTLAVTHNKRVVIKNSGDWSQGWEIFIDKNNNGLRDPDEEIVELQPPSADIQTQANSPVSHYLSFIGTGESRLIGRENSGGFQAGTITVCPTKTGSGYKLILARSGRLRLNEISIDDCGI